MGMTQQELALEMALKIAQVFNLKVEDLFELRQKEET